MTATYPEEYFKKYTEVLFKKYRKDCDYEHRLSILLPDFDSIAELPEEAKKTALEAVKKIAVKRVVDEATEDLKKTMHMIKEIKEGRAGLGYTTKVQEISAWHDINEGFEFSCYMLSQFKKKHGIL